jgi:hypothetical protein
MKLNIKGMEEIEVFANQGGSITIRQVDQYDGEALVVVHPLQVPSLLKALEQLAQELANEPLLHEETEEETEQSK